MPPEHKSPHGMQRGFSLIEMVLSLSLVGLVLASLGSVLAFAMGAAPQPHDPASRLSATQLPLSIMAEEIGSAKEFLSIANDKIVFRIDDRNGDGADDTIAYFWDGSPGDPMLRQINADPAVEVLDELNAFSITAQSSSFSFETIQPDGGTDFETELSADTSALVKVVALLNSRMQPVRLAHGFSQRIRNSALPDDTLYWVPESVAVLLERESSPGAVRLEVRVSESGSPSYRAIAGRVVRTDELGSENWVEVRIPGTLQLDRGTELAVVLICIDGDRSVSTRVFEQLVFASEPAMRRSSDAGDSWVSDLTTRMAFQLRGTYFTEASRVTATETVVESVRIDLNTSPSPQTGLVTGVDLAAPVRLSP
jgi:prepilin-type N-terminal cleavage/methylation domain-containing protein